MKNTYKSMNDSYDDGNIPEIDIDPYEEKELKSDSKKNKYKGNYSTGYKNDYDDLEY